METAVCQGQIEGNRIRAQCRTIYDTEGEMTLELTENGNFLTGKYQDAMTGIQVALSMSR